MRPSSPKASIEGHCGGLRGRDPAPRQSLRAAWCRREREGWVTPGAEQSSRHWSVWLPGPVARRSQSLAAEKPGWGCRWETLGAEARRPAETTEWVAEMRQSIGPWRWARVWSLRGPHWTGEPGPHGACFPSQACRGHPAPRWGSISIHCSGPSAQVPLSPTMQCGAPAGIPEASGS